MRSRTRVIAAAAVAAALAAGGAGAAVASTTGTKPGAQPSTVSGAQPSTSSAGGKRAGGGDLAGQPGGAKAAMAKAADATPTGGPGYDALAAAVATELHLSTALANATLRPLLAAGLIDSSSREFVAAARSLGVSPQQLSAALVQAKQSLAGGK